MLWRLGLFSSRGCCFFRRKSSSSSSSSSTPKDGLPKRVQQALTQLEGVTEKRDAQPGESADTECPICLGCLFASDQQQQQTSSPSPRDAAEEVDLEAGKGSVSITTTTTSGDSEKQQQQQQQPINDEVLKMKRCTHMFHARCLATWFMNRKYECPVCRTVYYYQPPPPPPSSSSSSPAEAREGTGTASSTREESDEEYWYRREQDEYMHRQQLAYSIMPFF
ncbi:hypothetical protein F5X96DRAFT_56003 [Biscogniauxia mediterranea]|nr:hypothetical protein F5X96DRAFT_56003 [Biscogniauxia mediterranea]